MIYALNPNSVIRAVSLLTCVLCTLVVWFLAPASTEPFWKYTSTITSIITALTFALTFPIIYGFVHKLVWADRWGFPLLDGTWRATASSNWPRIAALIKAARHGSAPFDAMSDELPIGGPEAETRFNVKITSSLFEIRITSRMSDTRTSRSTFVRPEKRGSSDPELYYIFEQDEAGRVAITDSKRHFGAARLRYDSQTQTLAGEYWTERRSESGLNTAGTILLVRHH